MKYRLTLLQNYSNYYNRQLKLHNRPELYLAQSALSFEANLAKKDDITASAVVNNNIAPTCDYLVAINKDTGLLDSRWFITDCVELSGSSYALTLRRDVIADYYKEIIESPCFIEKAILGINDPGIWNSENMTFNQVLANKYLLKDSTKSAWIVGYLPKNAPTEQKKVEADFVTSASADITVDNFENWEYYQYSNLGDNRGFKGLPQAYTYNINWSESYSPDRTYQTQMDDQGAYLGTTKKNDSEATLKCFASSTYGGVIIRNFTENAELTQGLNDLAYLYKRNEFSSQEELDDFKALQGKRITNGTLTYEISVERKTGSFAADVTKGSNLGQYLFNNLNVKASGTAYDNTTFRVLYSTEAYYLVLTQIFSKVEATIGTSSTRIHTEDTLYDMFCIPYHPIDCTAGSGTFENKTEAALAIASALALEADLAIYDLQILPYCPISSIIEYNRISVTNRPYTLVTDSEGNNVSIILFCDRASFETRIPFRWKMKNTAIESKIACECDMMRIVSPTNNGVFEFSPEKNKGINEIIVSCTYKPFNPFIHLKPDFKGIYGDTFEKDSRGCVCGGDFSLPRLSSAWEQYEYQNKNYEEIFNRQIENMEIKNQYQDTASVINAITGTLGGTVSGVMGGAMASGGPIGGAIGGTVGGLASAAAGIADVGIGRALRAETLDYTKDLYGYQLGNIKALAYSLVSTGAQTLINTLFPYIEYYTASIVEKQALRNKITYNGMTVMRIGTIKEFLTNEETYIKGRLIRLPIKADTHVLNVIAEEVNKGVFIKEFIDDSE